MFLSHFVSYNLPGIIFLFELAFALLNNVIIHIYPNFLSILSCDFESLVSSEVSPTIATSQKS